MLHNTHRNMNIKKYIYKQRQEEWKQQKKNERENIVDQKMVG